MAYIAAFVIVAIWGATFVQTKLLINAGLRPDEIFFYRFLIAYLLILPFSCRKLFLDNWADEFLAFSLGITGGSLYFVTENYALVYGYCYNVSLIVCITPLVTAFFARWFYSSEHFSNNSLWASLIALAGMALVVFNGNFILKLSPLGDALAIAACLCWTAYSLVLKKLQASYGTMLLTRKVFGYGLITILPLLFMNEPHWSVLCSGGPVVWGNILALGCVASMLCFLGWNVCLKELGTVRATNLIYFNPVVTMITSAIVLHERVTWLALLGAVMILLGLFLVEKMR